MGSLLNENQRIERFKQQMGQWVTAKTLEYLVEHGFFLAPASKTFHGNYEGGLDDHSFETAAKLAEMTEQMNLKWQNPRSPFIVGHLHDICKMEAYRHVRPDIPQMGYENRDDSLIPGHGDKSVMILSSLMQLTEEEILCIRYHMGAYEKEDWAYFDRAIRKYPNVLWTHTADMYSSKVLDT